MRAARRADGAMEHTSGGGRGSDVRSAGTAAYGLRNAGVVGPGRGRDPANLGSAGECGLALFGDRAGGGMEGKPAEGRVSVLRFAEGRGGVGDLGDLSGDLQSAG